MGRRTIGAGAVLGLLASAVLGAGQAVATGGSLPRATAGVRPGPSLLYERPAVAPQLTNTAPWTAAPILVSGASAYRDGEFVYQDFLYDDHGAKAARDPGDRRSPGDVFSAPNGTYTYPTGPGYLANAADLVELRVKPLPDATALRLTLNTLVDPELVGATIAIGTSPSPRPFPHGANVSAPAALFLTWHGRTADLLDAATGQPVPGGAPAVRVDLARRQVELRVPHASWAPGQAVVRLAAGVGLWDRASDRYLLPQAAADATHPGGASGLEPPPAFFNVAFRAAEPFQHTSDISALTDPAWWRDRLQGHALAAHDLSTLFADVDFGRLARRAGDESGVPRTGPMNRILASHFEPAQGRDDTVACFGKPVCRGELRGRLQPYAIYVPRRRAAGGRYPLTLLLHSLTASYNQFSDSRNQSQFGERARPSIVVTPEGRGPDGFYRDLAGADAFEVWADVAARYRLDPSRTAIAGYSMGGYGTFKLASQFPDLFAAAQPTVGALDVPAALTASLRWVPFLMWNSAKDELVPPSQFEVAANALRAHGYRYGLGVVSPVDPAPPAPTPQHLQLAINDQFAPAAAFLDGPRVVRDPPRVTFATAPALDFPQDRTTADHAYWVSRVRVRRPGAGATGTIDVRSDGFGVGEPRVRRLPASRLSLAGGVLGARPMAQTGLTWGSAPRRPKRDRLDIVARNVASVRIDATRARVSCRANLHVRSDGPLRVALVHCPRRR